MFRVCSYFLQSLKMRFSFKGLIYYCSLNCQIAIETLGVQVYKQELEGWRSSTVSWIDIYRFDRTSIELTSTALIRTYKVFCFLDIR